MTSNSGIPMVAETGARGATSGEGALGEESWTAILAHELRNPLSAIVMALGVLQPRYAADPEARELLEAAERGSRQMANIIDDVLELYRSRQGKLSVHREVVDVRAIVERAIESTRPTLSSARHALMLSIPAGLPKVHAHPSRLQQIITNLLANAAKYTPPGGTIHLTACIVAGLVELRVRDNGIGIPVELLPHVFTLYRQGPGARQGLGIGLAVVKSLVELDGGQVTVQSEGPGRGSEFIVRFPLSVVRRSSM